jgi:hypothetical protein
MYKFDSSAAMVIDASVGGVDEDGAAGESEHHRFWGLSSFIKGACAYKKAFYDLLKDLRPMDIRKQ